jgi:gas vesicle protein GvpA/GvpJ/GvpM family
VPDLPVAHRASGLVDVLDRVLDKGLVVAGDIKVSLAEVELLTIRIRLVVCSIDKAQSIGLDWWKHDGHLGAGSNSRGDQALRRQIDALERKVAALSARPSPTRRRLARPSARLRSRRRRGVNDAG